MFYKLCLSHSYLPDELMHTTVVPIIKNKTGDASDLSNYRPISLAIIVAKVLDSFLDDILGKNIKLHDAQFGFRPGLSTESATICLKQTFQYYTSHETPVFACFLDLSKAFDMVSYDLLWRKLHDSSVPRDVTSLFKYWYGSQRNCVRWAGAFSDAYVMQCGVRQGGLSSPKLFNIYINGLIEELSSAHVGCHIEDVCINNLSYADDMVLLCPSMGGLIKMIKICERYAETHGLRYNASKSELLQFKAGNKSYKMQTVTLCGTPLKRTEKFKYLGHWVTETMTDDVDIERERRALCVRCNMLARRFARASKQVKLTLFKAFCQTFYTCGLWTSFTKRAYSALRVQYNDAFRMLFGLPRYCSASAMFADAQTDCFYAIMRKRTTSLLNRSRGSSNGILSTLAQRWDSPLVWRHAQLHAPVAAPTRRF
jgi:hypothetical protein